MSNIILIGFMGSGKTSVGKKLAEIMKLAFVDLDLKIVEKAGISINEIFDRFGETKFRQLESGMLSEFSDKNGFVIATGGGIVTIPENIPVLKKTGKVIYLKNSFETSRLRVGEKGDRPLFRDIDKAARLFEKRQPLYEMAADLIIDTDDLNVTETAKKAAGSAGVKL